MAAAFSNLLADSQSLKVFSRTDPLLRVYPEVLAGTQEVGLTSSKLVRKSDRRAGQ